MMGPNPAPLYLNSTLGRLRLGKFKEALHYASRAVTNNTNSNYLDTLAHAAYGLELWEEAVRAWDKVLDRDGPFTHYSYCKEDLELYKTAGDKAGLSPRQITPNP